MSEELKFRDELPPGCPPEDAQEISEARVMYYLITSFPPTDLDFVPVAMQRDVSADPAEVICRAHGLSVFNTRRQLERGPGALLPFHGHLISRLHLVPRAGRIKRTGKNRGHHTFWPYASFNLLEHCEPVE